MDWYAIGLAGASGLLAGLIAMLIVGWKNFGEKNSHFIVLAVLMVLIYLLSREFILPELHAIQAKSF